MASVRAAMRAVVGVLGILSLLVLLPNAQAGSLETITPPRAQTVNIALDDYEPFQVTVPSDWSLVLAVDVVTSGANIDIYVMFQSGYDNYTNPNAPNFFTLRWSQQNTRSYNKTISEAGLYYVVLDNAAISQDGANPTSAVTASVFFGISTFNPLVTGLIVLAILVIIVIVVAVLIRRRRKPAMAPPMTPPMGQPPAWQQQQPPTWPQEPPTSPPPP